MALTCSKAFSLFLKLPEANEGPGTSTQNPHQLILHRVGKTDLYVRTEQSIPAEFCKFPEDRRRCGEGKDQR